MTPWRAATPRNPSPDRNIAAGQGLPCQTYIAAFDRMQSVVFVNAFGKEVAIWKELTGSQLSEQYFEGDRHTLVTCPRPNGVLLMVCCCISTASNRPPWLHPPAPCKMQHSHAWQIAVSGARRPVDCCCTIGPGKLCSGRKHLLHWVSQMPPHSTDQDGPTPMLLRPQHVCLMPAASVVLWSWGAAVWAEACCVPCRLQGQHSAGAGGSHQAPG